jgi:GWxTD domain-containing protein
MTVANTLAWALVHAIWEGALIALMLAIALCFLASSRVRYVAACAALGAMLAAFGITAAHLMPADYRFDAPVPSLHAIPGGTNPAAFIFAPATPALQLPGWIAPLWLAGVIFFELRALGGCLALWRWRRTGVCHTAAEWQTRLSELASGLRVARPVVLLQSSLAEAPSVIGHLRPVILMPLGLLTGLPAAQIETILLHELAHIRRHDYLVNMAQTFAEGVLFYHPAVWWISNVIRTERENCCDDLVVAARGDAHEYAAALAALAENRWAAHDLAPAATGGSLVKRVRRLLTQQPEGPRAALTPVFAAGLIAIGSGIALLAFQSGSPKPAQVLAQAREATPPAESPWDKWLTEDVAYIITNEERNAFRQLGTDAEREHFVEQFWLRRDPTPGTPENEFREEHYRRIGYANSHFTTPSGLPGWKTDRGRIYITFGPPDEIDAHPPAGARQRPAAGGGQTSAYPYEDWRYRFIEGIGDNVQIEFVDQAMTGDYRMTMDPRASESNR